MEGAFNKLVAYASLTGRQIDLEFAQGMLADFVRANARRITIDEIQKLTAQHFQIDQSEMRSKRRARAVVRPRQIAMYLAKKMRSEEHTSELQSLMRISYAVFCLKKKKQ